MVPTHWPEKITAMAYGQDLLDKIAQLPPWVTTLAKDVTFSGFKDGMLWDVKLPGIKVLLSSGQTVQTSNAFLAHSYSGVRITLIHNLETEKFYVEEYIPWISKIKALIDTKENTVRGAQSVLSAYGSLNTAIKEVPSLRGVITQRQADELERKVERTKRAPQEPKVRVKAAEDAVGQLISGATLLRISGQ